jgi:hypothetical protein
MNKEQFTRKSEFISVEIAIKTNRESNAFVRWFEDQHNYVHKLAWNPEKWYIYCDPIRGRDANSVICKLCRMIEKFPPDDRKDWDRAKHREFFAGYAGGDEPRAFAEHISLATLQAALSVKASIGFVIYSAVPTDADGFPEDFYQGIQSEQGAPSNGG